MGNGLRNDTFSDFENDVELLKNKIQDKSVKDNILAVIDALSKIVTILTFLSLIYGGWFLFSFSAEHGVSYLDLIKPDVMIAYGVLTASLILVLLMFPLVVLCFNMTAAGSAYVVYVCYSKIIIVRKFRSASIFILSALQSLWPFVFISFGGTKGIILSLLYPLLISIVGLLFSRKTWHSFFVKIKKININYFILFLPSFDALFLMLSFSYVAVMMKETLNGINEFVIAIMLSFISFFCKLPSMKKTKREGKSVFWVCSAILALCVFYLFSFHLDNVITNKTAFAIGLMPKNNCFIRKEVRDVGIPDEYINQKFSNESIVKLNVIVKLENLYYLAYNGEVRASMRIEGINLKEVRCPVFNETKSKNSKE